MVTHHQPSQRVRWFPGMRGDELGIFTLELVAVLSLSSTAIVCLELGSAVDDVPNAVKNGTQFELSSS